MNWEEPYRIIVGNTLIDLRRGTSEEWVKENPILRFHEVGYDLTEHKIKRGDGRTPWSDLPWFATIHIEG